MLTQEELDMEELEELKRKLMNGEITEDELRRLMELQQKYGIQFSDEELNMIREAEDRLCDDRSRHTEAEENFQELPPVVVMNRVDSPPPAAEEELSQATDDEQNAFADDNQRLL